jgi:hypothetical protein
MGRSTKQCPDNRARRDRVNLIRTAENLRQILSAQMKSATSVEHKLAVALRFESAGFFWWLQPSPPTTPIRSGASKHRIILVP